MDPNDLLRKPDPLNSGVVIFFLLAGGLAFVLGAWQSGVAGLPEVVAGTVCWACAWHFKQLGRLY